MGYHDGAIEFSEQKDIPRVFKTVYKELEETHGLVYTLENDSCLLIPVSEELLQRLGPLFSGDIYVDKNISKAFKLFTDDEDDAYYLDLAKQVVNNPLPSILFLDRDQWGNKILLEELIKNEKPFSIALKQKEDEFLKSYRDPDRWK